MDIQRLLIRELTQKYLILYKLPNMQAHLVVSISTMSSPPSDKHITTGIDSAFNALLAEAFLCGTKILSYMHKHASD